MTTTMAGPLRLTTPLLAVAAVVATLAVVLWISVDGYWIDELFTLAVIGRDHSLAAVGHRIVGDVHPPLYYLAIFGWSELFGTSEAALRSLSVIASIAAIALFVAGTRPAFSLRARLFAAALAATSRFWMRQAHNARSNALVELVATAVLVLALRLLDRERDGRPSGGVFAGLVAAMAVGASIHFYMLFVDVAALAALFLLCPRRRVALAAVAVVLTIVVFAYEHFVVAPNTEFLTTHSWFGTTAKWYLEQTLLAAHATLALPQAIVVALLLAFAWSGRRGPLPAATRAAGLLCLLVPVLVVVGGIAASVLVAPSYTDRNVLAAAPFAWGALALVFDTAMQRRGAAVAGLLAAVALIVLLPTALFNRTANNEPYRETAAAIAAHPDCHGATIPVLIDRVQAMKGDSGARLARGFYGFYLPADITTVPVYIEDIRRGVAPPPSHCAVVAWAVHYLPGTKNAEAFRGQLAVVLGRPVRLTVFPVAHDPSGYVAGFVFTADPPRR